MAHRLDVIGARALLELALELVGHAVEGLHVALGVAEHGNSSGNRLGVGRPEVRGYLWERHEVISPT